MYFSFPFRRFTPSGGQSRKAGMRIRASVSRGSSNPSSRAASEEFEASLSSSGQSDEEFIQNQTSKSKVNGSGLFIQWNLYIVVTLETQPVDCYTEVVCLYGGTCI